MKYNRLKPVLRELGSNLLYHSRLLHLLQHLSNPRWRILTYHRVIDPQLGSTPLQPGMFVRPQTFETQMNYLSTHCNVIKLDDLIEGLINGRSFPTRTIVITFDDGWLDTYTNAFPVLKNLKLPATIFLPTAFIGTNRMFWTDKVGKALNALQKAKQFKEQIQTRLSKMAEQIDLRDKLSSFVSEASQSSNTEPLDIIINQLKNTHEGEREKLVSELVQLAKEFTSWQSERLFMNWSEVKEMSLAKISFGSHAHRHLNFNEIDNKLLCDELINSLQTFKEQNISPVSVFCYPGGYFSEQSQKELNKFDFKFALSTCKHSDLTTKPKLLGRINIHQDISTTIPLFCSRILI